jgi:hypothetical protein
LVAEITVRRGVALHAVQRDERLGLDIIAKLRGGLCGIRLEGEVLEDRRETLVSDIADVAVVRIAAVRRRAPGCGDIGGQIRWGEGAVAQCDRAGRG